MNRLHVLFLVALLAVASVTSLAEGPPGPRAASGPGEMLLSDDLDRVPAPIQTHVRKRPSTVSHIKVLSNHVEDVTTLEDWKRTYIKAGMSDQEKALAVWKTVVKYRHQTAPPREELMNGGCAHDPMKTIHVYGYGQCCCASSNIEGLARYIGLPCAGGSLTATACQRSSTTTRGTCSMRR